MDDYLVEDENTPDPISAKFGELEGKIDAIANAISSLGRPAEPEAEAEPQVMPSEGAPDMYADPVGYARFVHEQAMNAAVMASLPGAQREAVNTVMREKGLPETARQYVEEAVKSIGPAVIEGLPKGAIDQIGRYARGSVLDVEATAQAQRSTVTVPAVTSDYSVDQITSYVQGSMAFDGVAKGLGIPRNSLTPDMPEVRKVLKASGIIK